MPRKRGNGLDAFLALLVFTAFLAAAPRAANPSRAQQPTGIKIPIRAVWAYPGFFGAEQKAAAGKIRSTLDEVVTAGINTVIILVKSSSGYLPYRSQIGEKDPAYDWDFFGVFLEEAQSSIASCARASAWPHPTIKTHRKACSNRLRSAKNWVEMGCFSSLPRA